MTDQAHKHHCLLRWICRASDSDRAKFVEVSNKVRGKDETADLLAEAREMFKEMKKRGEA